MKHAFFATLTVAGALFPVAHALAQEAQAPMHRVVPTVTRTVQTFSNLEISLIDAIDRHDSDGAAKLLNDRFEMRTSGQPSYPVPRDLWLKHLGDAFKSTSAIEQLAVHEYGDVMVVSFLWRMKNDIPNPTSSQIFVVDTWKSVEGSWKLDTRYAAESEGAQGFIPGDEPTKPQSKKKI